MINKLTQRHSCDSEEKELLLKDLCARLPYGVIVKVSKEDNGSIKSYDKSFDAKTYELLLLNGGYQERGIMYHYPQFSLKPYLRPMSSITEEEFQELHNICPHSTYNKTNVPGWIVGIDGSDYGRISRIDEINKLIDWLNAHHFDYRNLIEKGLALGAPEGMYKN